MTRRDRGDPPPILAVGDLLVEVRGARVDLGGRTILADVDLEVRAGEVLALVGPNGAGKSTLLHLLTGDLAASAGTVLVGGRPEAELRPWELARRRAVLPQQVTVSFPFTVEEVVHMGRAPWRRTAAEALDDLIVADAVARVDVAHLLHRRFPSLSGGERARTALARVLAQQTQLLLLDEPTAALDLHHQELVLEVARDRAAEGAGVLAVLHDLGLAAAHADRVAVLDGGRVVAVGPPSEVLVPDLLSRVYRHDVEVFPHPRTGVPVVLPARPVRSGVASASTL